MASTSGYGIDAARPSCSGQVSGPLKGRPRSETSADPLGRRARVEGVIGLMQVDLLLTEPKCRRSIRRVDALEVEALFRSRPSID